MPSFTFKWDDFINGYFVGESDSRQPKNTFTGQNVNITTHDGSLVATNAITEVATITSDFASGGTDEYVTVTVQDGTLHILTDATAGSFFVSQPVQNGGSVFFAVQHRGVDTGLWLYQLYFQDELNPENGAVLYRSSKIVIDPGPSNYLISNVLVTQESALTNFAYVAYRNKIYRFATSTSASPTLSSTITTQFTTSPDQPISGLTIWNARMLAWSEATDTFYFSNALDFATWPTLNFIAPGYSNNGILFIAPRWDDMLVVKPNSVFSVSGVLGTNSVARQIADGMYPADSKYGSMTSQNNALFFISGSVSPYATNLYALSGQKSSVVAYQNFGRFVVDNYGTDYVTQPSLYAGGNGDVAVVYARDLTGVDGFGCLIRDKDGKFIKLINGSFDFYAPNNNQNRFIRRVSAASNSTAPGSDSWYGNFGFSSNVIVFMQVATNGEYSESVQRMWAKEKSISFGVFRKNQVNSGVEHGGSGLTGWVDFPYVTTGKLILSAIETEKPSKITRVYVEAALDLDQANWDDFVGNGLLNVTVNNGSVDDIVFSPTPNFVSSDRQFDLTLSEIPDTTSYNYLTPGEFPAEPFATGNPDKRLSATRVVRFDSNDTGYGYKHNVTIDFSGFRIKRVWVEGETR